MSDPENTAARDVPYFEQALTDAMHSVTRDVGPIAVDMARLDRRARAWRSASVVAFATGAAFLVAATTVAVVGGDLSLRAGPAGVDAVGSVTPTTAGAPATPAAPAASGPAASPSPASLPPTAAGSPEATDDPTAPPADATSPDGEPPPDPDEDEAPPEAAPPPDACTSVPDGSRAVRGLVLTEARRQLDDRLADYPDGDDDDDGGPPGWLRDPSDEELLERLDMAEAIEDVERRDDIVDCGGSLRYASTDAGDLGRVVEVEVADELDDSLPGASGDGDDDD